MLHYEDAIKKIQEALQKRSTTAIEVLPTSKCNQRILANDIISEINVPPADNSAMDGIALCLNDARLLGGTLPISQNIPAGGIVAELKRHTAARIFTGGEIPKHADTVIIQENCTIDDDQVVIHAEALRHSNVGQHIRPAGQDFGKGTTLLKKGTRLNAQHLALITSAGLTQCTVFKKVSVAIFSTGNELIEAGKHLQKGQIYDSNRTLITQLCLQQHCDVITSCHLPDDPRTIQDAFGKASQDADILFSCGGVSVGEADYVKDCVESLGDLNFWKVNIKPGKPIAVGKINECTVLCLPGNPVSAFITFILFGKTALNACAGETPTPLKTSFYPSHFQQKKKNARTEFARINLTKEGAERLENQSSGVLSSICNAEALAIIPANTTIEPGDLLQIIHY